MTATIDRGKQLLDGELFATNLIRILEALEKLERGAQRSRWQQNSKATRAVRAEIRRVIDADRARRRRQATRP